MNLLSAERIREAISGASRSRLDLLEVFSEIESTNSYLIEQPCPAHGRYRVALAEYQTAGRGRMDRRWQSPRSSGVCMSAAYTFSGMPANIPSLSLAIGIGIAQALQGIGVPDIGLKWPNDIFVRDAKICGILLEVAQRGAAGLTVVIGVGLNVDLGDEAMSSAGPTGNITDLASCCDDLPSRSVIAAALIENVFSTLQSFAADGFARFHSTWIRYDWLRGKRIKVATTDGMLTGVADGIAADGALLLNSRNSVQHLISGSVMLDDSGSR